MPRLSAYLLRALLLALVFVTLAVTAAIWLTQSLRYIDIVVENGAPLHMFVWLALLTLPAFLGLTLPITLFVAVLFTYYRFIQDSELVAMRACGLSPRALAMPALRLASWCLLVGYLLTLWLQPLANQELAQMKYAVQSQFSAALLKEGTFNDLGNKMTVYVARREQNAELQGLLIHDARDPAKLMTIRAARGQLVQSSSGPKVIVYEGIQQEYNPATRKMAELTFDSYAVSLDTLTPDIANRVIVPREMSTYSLLAAVLASGPSALRARHLSELHQRMVTPLLTLGFTMIACASLLFGEFNRRGHVPRVLLAIGLAATLQAVVLGLGQLVSRSAWVALPLYIAALLPILLIGTSLGRQPEPRWAR